MDKDKNGFLGGSSGKELAYQCRTCKRRGFDPWVGKIPWSRKWQPTTVFLPGKFHGQRSLVGYIVHGVTKSRTRRKIDITCTQGNGNFRSLALLLLNIGKGKRYSGIGIYYNWLL